MLLVYRIRLTLVLLAAMIPSSASIGQPRSDQFTAARHKLVREEIIGAGIKDPRVVQSIRETPRHEFIPRRLRDRAYLDMALPIGHEQTISPPFVVAYMTEQLNPQQSDKVLEIGTGSGYQAAVLSPLVQDVFSIEIVEPLGRKAASTLKRLGYDNVHTQIGDGFLGWPQHAPFDKIIVTCSPERIPQPLVEQLAEGGRIVIPLGERFDQELYLFTKKDGKLERESLQGTFFVPMTGQAEQIRQIKSDKPFIPLVHGGFEETIGDNREPAGWYYVRQGRVEKDTSAQQGEHYLEFNNDTRGRNAHALQAFGVDGRDVKLLNVSVWVRGAKLAHGQSLQQRPRVMLEFYDDLRAPVGNARLGPWIGEFGWRRATKQVRVPPRARLAVIGIGLFGATGTISFDDLQISPSGPR